MELIRGFKYRLYPTKEQSILLSNHCFNVNQTFNILVSLNRKQFKFNKDKITLPNLNIFSQEVLDKKRLYLSSTSEDDIIKYILKKRNLNINTKVLQQTRMLFNKDLQKKLKNIESLKNDYYNKEALKKLKDKNYIIKPFELFNFKKYSNLSYQSFQTTKEQFTLLDYKDNNNNIISNKWKILRLFGQDFKIKWSRNLISNIKTITISKDPSNQWFIAFSQIIPLTFKQKTIHQEENILGMDLNLNNIVFSDGKKFSHTIKNKNLLKNNEKLIKLEQKRSKKIEEAKKQKIKYEKVAGYVKTNLKINKIMKKNTNIKDYELHKFVNQLIEYMQEKRITLLKIEKLNVKSMTSKEQDKKNVIKGLRKENSKSMRKNILQVSFSKLQQILTYKCVQIGIMVEYVEAKNTSKKCSYCGEINYDLTIKDRNWICKKCGKEHNRDWNAAINIKYGKPSVNKL